MLLLFDLARERGKSVVVVSHDSRITEIADRVLWLEDGRLSDQLPQIGEAVRDPVCGMRLELKDATFFTNYRGRVCYFDTEKCRRKFRADPEAYISDL